MHIRGGRIFCANTKLLHTYSDPGIVGLCVRRGIQEATHLRCRGVSVYSMVYTSSSGVGVGNLLAKEN